MRDGGRPGASLLRALALLLLVPLIAACAGGPRVTAPPEVVARATYVNGGPAEITLLTVVNNRTGAGDHSALVIAGSQRVLYDPAGSFAHPRTPRSGDVLYGLSPALETIYLGYHARETHHVISQTIPVDRATADAAIATAERLPTAGPGFCAVRTAAVLRSLPGLEGLPSTFFPRRLSESLAAATGTPVRQIFVEDIPPAARTRGPDDPVPAS